jgi:hypothetical protein
MLTGRTGGVGHRRPRPLRLRHGPSLSSIRGHGGLREAKQLETWFHERKVGENRHGWFLRPAIGELPVDDVEIRFLDPPRVEIARAPIEVDTRKSIAIVTGWRSKAPSGGDPGLAAVGRWRQRPRAARCDGPVGPEGDDRPLRADHRPSEGVPGAGKLPLRRRCVPWAGCSHAVTPRPVDAPVQEVHPWPRRCRSRASWRPAR